MVPQRHFLENSCHKCNHYKIFDHTHIMSSRKGVVGWVGQCSLDDNDYALGGGAQWALM